MIEKIMADKLGRRLQMVCCLESEIGKHSEPDAAGESAKEDNRELAKRASEILGIEVEID